MGSSHTQVGPGIVVFAALVDSGDELGRGELFHRRVILAILATPCGRVTAVLIWWGDFADRGSSGVRRAPATARAQDVGIMVKAGCEKPWRRSVAESLVCWGEEGGVEGSDC